MRLTLMSVAVDELGLTGIRELSERMDLNELIEYLGFRKVKADHKEADRLASEARAGVERAKKLPRRGGT